MKTATTSNKYAAIYARVSTKDQTRGQFASNEAQVANGTRYIKQTLGLCRAISEYVENGITGEEFRRPELQRLLRAVKAGRVAVLVVSDMDRLSRNVRDALAIYDILVSHGVELHTHSGQIDLSDPERYLDAVDDAVDASRERLKTSRRVRRKRQANVRNGRYNGGTPPPGYIVKGSRSGLQECETYAPVVREIFVRVQAGDSPSSIKNELTRRGIRTPVRMVQTHDGSPRQIGGRPFRVETIEQIVRNPIYRGIFRDPDTGEEFTSQHHKPLVSDSLWQTANAKLDQLKVTRTPQTEVPDELRDRDRRCHLLKNLLVCGDCGQRMTPHAAGKRRRDGTSFDYYTCLRVMKDASECHCRSRHIPAQGVERAVLTFLGESIRHREAISMIVGSAGHLRSRVADEKRARLKEVQNQIERVKGEIENLIATVRVVGPGALTEALRASADELSSRREALSAEHAELRDWLVASEQGVPSEASVSAALARFDWLMGHLSRESQREFVALFLRKVEVHRVVDPNVSGRVFRLVLYMDPVNLVAAVGERASQDAPPEPRRRVTGQRHPSFGTPVEIGVRFRSGKDSTAVELIHPFQVSRLREITTEPTGACAGTTDSMHPVLRAFAWQRELKQNPTLKAAGIARKTGRTPASVSQHLKLLQLAPEVLDYFRKAPLAPSVQAISLRSLVSLAKLTPDQQRLKFQSLLSKSTPGQSDAVA